MQNINRYRDNFMDLDENIKNLLANEWHFAKTMPKFPHWYTLRREWEDGDSFENAVLFIRENGYKSKYYNATYIYLEHDGCRYWTMGFPVDETTLINRAQLDD